MAKKSGLGKGLEALFEDNSTPLSENGAELIKISEISPNKGQPRKDFDQAAMEQLADSIREHGVIQPLILRPMSTGGYQIVAGERRYRASRMAGLTEVPAVIRELSDTQAMEIALIENLQREDLNPIEEALGYQELMDQFDFTQEQVSKSVGKSRPVVANALRLLNLPDKIVEYVRKGMLTTGHARALLSFETEEEQLEAAEKAIKLGLTVRDLEKMGKKETAAPRRKASRESFYDEMELAMKNELGRATKVKKISDKKGTLTIEFYGEDDLRTLGHQLCGVQVEMEDDEVVLHNLRMLREVYEFDDDTRTFFDELIASKGKK